MVFAFPETIKLPVSQPNKMTYKLEHITHKTYLLLAIVTGLFSCNQVDSEIENKQVDASIYKSIDGKEREEVRTWNVNGTEIETAVLTSYQEGTILKLMEYPKELLLQRSSNNNSLPNGKVFLFEISPDQTLNNYKIEAGMTDDEFMTYLSFEIKNKFVVVTSDSITDLPDGLIYEPGHGVKPQERFILFFNNEALFDSSFSILFTDRIFQNEISEFRF